MIRNVLIKYGTVVNTTTALTFYDKKNCSYFGAVVTSIPVYVTNNFKHWVTNDTYVKINCDATIFTTDVGWITRNMIVILFRLKNLNSTLCVRRSENKTIICLAHFFVSQSSCN